MLTRNQNILAEVHRILKERTGNPRHDITNLEMFRMGNFGQDEILSELPQHLSFTVPLSNGVDEYSLDQFSTELGAYNMIQYDFYLIVDLVGTTTTITKQRGFSNTVTAAFDVNGDLKITCIDTFPDTTEIDPNIDHLPYAKTATDELTLYFSSITFGASDTCRVIVKKEKT